MYKKKKLKVVFLLPSLEVGGMERELINIVKEINDHKFDVSIWLMERKGEFLNEISDKVKIVDLKKKGKLSMFKLIVKIRDLLQLEKPDIVVQFTSNHSGFYLIIGNWLSKIKTKVVIYVPIVISSYLKTLSGKVRGLMIGIFYPRSVDFFIAKSLAVKNDLVSSYGVDGKRVKVMPSTIDYKKIKSFSELQVENRYESIDQEDPLIVVMSRLVNQKRIDHILKSFKVVLKKIEAKLLIIGSGPEKVKIRQLIDELELKDKVTMTGYQSNPWKYLKKAEIFAFASLLEGSSHCLIEAMASGVPIVTTDFLGVEEMITNDFNGLVVSGNDLYEFSEAIVKVIKNKNLAKRLRLNGKREVIRFDIKERISDYEKMLKSFAFS